VTLFRRAASNAVERRAITSLQSLSPHANQNSVPTNWDGMLNASGVPVTDHTALKLSVFYACVQILSDDVASLPWDSYRKRGGLRVEVDPQPSLLLEPYPGLTDVESKQQMMVSLCIRGNFYGHVQERDALDYPTAIEPLHPDQVMVDRDPDTFAKRVRINGQRIDARDLFHVRRFSLPGSDVGLSPVRNHAQTLGLALAAEEFGAKWFRDGAAPSSALETDAQLTDDQVRRVQQTWISSHGGRRRPAVLTGGFKWRPITFTPEESQFLETRKFQVEEVARAFRIPLYMLQSIEKQTSWGTGVEQQGISYVTHTLRPWLVHIEAAISRCLPRGQFMRFNVSGLLRGDIKSRYEAYRTAVEGGWMNRDEVRALADRNSTAA